MAHDVFISYSSEDKLAADAVCGALEAARIRCWIAPRDVVPARSYSGEITRAINNSRVMVLIFSEHANVSAAVLSEVELAANARIPILNFRVDDSPLGDDLRFYLQRLHWLDALTPPMEQHHARLVQMVQRLLAPSSTPKEEELPPPPPAPPVVVPRTPGGWQAPKFLSLRKLLLVALVAGGAVAIWSWIFGPSPPPQPPRTVTPTPSAATSSPIATPESSPTIQKGDGLSTDRDKPTLLTSNEIRGKGVGERISYYCTFNAGPGEVKVTVDGKNKPGIQDITAPVAVEISDLDAKRLFYVEVAFTTTDQRKVERFQLGRRQQVIMRILLSKHTLDYMVRVEDRIEFSPAPKLTPTPIAATSSPIAMPESSPPIQKADGLSTDRDKPTLLTSNEIRGKGVGETISYYCTFNAGPGEVKVTVDGKNKPGFHAKAIGGGSTDVADVEISDLDAKRLFYIAMGDTTIDQRKVESFQLGRRQQVIMRILLSKFTLDYMVRVEGTIDFSPAPKLQGPQ